jgi:hypothetical protein
MAKDGKSEANVDRTCILIMEVLLVMKLREDELEEHAYLKNNFPRRKHWLCICHVRRAIYKEETRPRRA